MYRKIHFINKDFVIRPYNTQEELDLLEYLACTDDKSETSLEFIADEFLKEHIRNYDNSLSSISKILLLYKIREITIGDEINLNFKCTKCKMPQSQTIALSNILSDSTEISEHVQHRILSCAEFNAVNFDDVVNDDIDFDVYENIMQNISNYFTIYNTKFECVCDCQCKNYVNMFTFEKALFFISDDTFKSLSECIHNIVYFGKCTRKDVLEMTPVSRILELNIINLSLKENNSNNADPLSVLRG